MKTKNFFQIALVAGMMSVATIANAQTYVGTASAQEDVDTTQVDYVTVGATMPYSTAAATAGLDAWKAEVVGAGITTSDKITTKFEWAIDGTPVSGATTNAIELKWEAEAAYKLTTEVSIAVDGLAAACDPAVSGKTVYVLPKPSAAFTAGGDTILACDITSHSLTIAAKGIGAKTVSYSVTKKPIGASGTTEDASVTAGTAVTTGSMFEESATTFAAAQAYYTGAGDAQTITVANLTPGYIYTVTANEVSDQISVKSGVTAELSDVKAVFTVVPVPTNTKINHVKNF